MLPWRGLSQDPYPYYLPNRSGRLGLPKNSWRNAWMMRSDALPSPYGLTELDINLYASALLNNS